MSTPERYTPEESTTEQPPRQPMSGAPPQPMSGAPEQVWPTGGYQLPWGPPPTAPPRPARPRRDSLIIQLAWEAVLLMVVIGLFIGYVSELPKFSAEVLFGEMGVVGLAAVAVAFSLRAGVPNLAVGAMAGFGGMAGAKLAVEQGWSDSAALIVGAAAVLGIGLVLGGLVAGLSVPAWAMTLGAGVALEAITFSMSGARVIAIPGNAAGEWWLWFAAFLVLSLGGAAVWAFVPSIRDVLGATRRTGEPGRWAGATPALGALIGLTVSGLVAGLAGMALVARLQSASPNSGTALTAQGLAAALIGGVSVYGRRAGLLGTLLGTAVVVLGQQLILLKNGPSWSMGVLLGGLIVAGLAVSRLIESLTDLLVSKP